MADTRTTNDRDRARRKAQNHFETYEQRTTLVKQMIADETAAVARKTEKLRALRLAKEEADRVEAAANPPPPATKKKKSATAK